MMLDLTLGVRAEFETKVWPYDRPQSHECYDARPDPLLARDFAVHLKTKNIPSAINDRPGDAVAVFAFGYSQGGRFLRDFVYHGFNTGPDGRRVFDGMLVTTAGSGRGSFEHRYALPGEAGNSVMSNLRAVDLYPFADVPTPDIDGTGYAGLLDRAVH